jgi:hypothetical protein
MNNTPFTTSPGYRVEIHGSPGRCAIKSPRGLVAIMEAGNADTREDDAARIVATVNAYPRALAILKELAEQHDEMLATFPKGFGWGRLISDKARAEIALAEGRAE